jgi:hypothetical protein
MSVEGVASTELVEVKHISTSDDALKPKSPSGAKGESALSAAYLSYLDARSSTSSTQIAPTSASDRRCH